METKLIRALKGAGCLVLLGVMAVALAGCDERGYRFQPGGTQYYGGGGVSYAGGGGYRQYDSPGVQTSYRGPVADAGRGGDRRSDGRDRERSNVRDRGNMRSERSAPQIRSSALSATSERSVSRVARSASPPPSNSQALRSAAPRTGMAAQRISAPLKQTPAPLPTVSRATGNIARTRQSSPPGASGTTRDGRKSGRN